LGALRARRSPARLHVYEASRVTRPPALAQVVLTPHLGRPWRLREQMAHVVVDNIQAVLKGERPPNLHNPEVYA
jgi:phosphoglycerate dehydrogenase-like enzyme